MADFISKLAQNFTDKATTRMGFQVLYMAWLTISSKHYNKFILVKLT